MTREDKLPGRAKRAQSISEVVGMHDIAKWPGAKCGCPVLTEVGGVLGPGRRGQDLSDACSTPAAFAASRESLLQFLDLD